MTAKPTGTSGERCWCSLPRPHWTGTPSTGGESNQTVRRLQARIVKATQEGRWGKVQALQHLLTHSFSGKALAVRRVTENQGKRTPGVDGVTWDTPAQKATAIGSAPATRLSCRNRCAGCISRRATASRRGLGIPTMRDRAMQALYLLALDPHRRNDGRPELLRVSDCSALPPMLSNSASLPWPRRRPRNGSWKATSAPCFDQISHDVAPGPHPDGQRASCSKWLKAGYMERNILHPTEAGTPQGGICSPVIAEHGLGRAGNTSPASVPALVWNGQQQVGPQGQLDPLCRRLPHHRRDSRSSWKMK